MRTKFAIAIVMTAALTLLAADDAQYKEWMKAAAGSCGSLRKNVDAKNASGAAADAMKAHEAFSKLESYWKEKKVADAAKFAKDAADAVHHAGEQASAGKWEEAGASVKAAGATCGGCHAAHREKAADGSWKIK